LINFIPDIDLIQWVCHVHSHVPVKLYLIKKIKRIGMSPIYSDNNNNDKNNNNNQLTYLVKVVIK